MSPLARVPQSMGGSLMPAATAPAARGRSAAEIRALRARMLAFLDETASNEYREVLRLIAERQCDSLADFAMAEHMRALLAQESK